MAILEYLGPFAKLDGRVLQYTIVSCRCDDCGKQWQTEYRTLKRYQNNLPIGNICRICTERGRPVDILGVMSKYPRVIRAKNLGRRGGVVATTRLIYNCQDCGSETASKYSSISNDGFLWMCQSCRNRLIRLSNPQKTTGAIYPENVDGLLWWDIETLGKSRQLADKTTIIFICNSCGRETTARWSYYRDGGRICRECSSRLRFTPETHKKMSDSAKAGWQNPEMRERFLAGREWGDYSKTLSGFHKRVKGVLVENGYTNFASEKWVARGIRVDEVDFTNKIVVEAFGNYWHANPQMYKADDVLTFPEGKLIARDIWERDRKRLDKIEKFGYRTIIIWESEFNKNNNRILELLGK